MVRVKVIFIIVLLFCVLLFADVYKGVKYEIINTTKVPNVKLSIDVRLDKKVTKEFLKKIAIKLRNDESKKYERTFILYFLPGMKTDTGAWASTHFDPKLEVEILGMTIEKEKELKKDKSSNSSDIIIGKWLDETPFASGKYTILKRKEEYIVTCKYLSGSTSEEIVIKSMYYGKSKFVELDNSAGEYYLIEKNGKLSIYDDMGIIVTMKSIK